MKAQNVAIALAPLAVLSAASIAANGQPNPLKTGWWDSQGTPTSGQVVTLAAAGFAAYWIFVRK